MPLAEAQSQWVAKLLAGQCALPPLEQMECAIDRDLEAMARIIGVDSLAFLSPDGLYQAVDGRRRDPLGPQYCDACFSGEYPTRLADFDDGTVDKQTSLMLEDA